MIAAAGLEPKDKGWKTSKVQQQKAAVVVVMAEAMLKKGVRLIKTRLLRKGQSSGSDTMLEILKSVVLYFMIKEYT